MAAMHDSIVQCDRSASDISCSESSSTGKPKLARRRKLEPTKITRNKKSAPDENGENDLLGGCSDSLSTTTSLSSSYGLPSAAHLSCQLTKDFPRYIEYYNPYTVFRKPLRKSLSLPDGFKNSFKLQHPDLTEGDREYLRQKAAVYSMTDMKKRAEWKFRQSLHHQIKTGFHTREECQKYFDYLDKPRKKKFGTPEYKVWRNPPKITPRPLHFHPRSATVPIEFRSESAMGGTKGSSPTPARPWSSYSPPVSWKDSASYYDRSTKRTLQGRKKPDPGV